MIPVISRRTILQVACVLDWSTPSVSPNLLLCTGCKFYGKVQGLDLIFFLILDHIQLGHLVWFSSYQYIHIISHSNVTLFISKSMRSMEAGFSEHKPIHLGVPRSETLQLTWNIFEKDRLSVHLPSPVHVQEAVFLSASEGT